jgi:hypothetical protein
MSKTFTSEWKENKLHQSVSIVSLELWRGKRKKEVVTFHLSPSKRKTPTLNWYDKKVQDFPGKTKKKDENESDREWIT